MSAASNEGADAELDLRVLDELGYVRGTKTGAELLLTASTGKALWMAERLSSAGGGEVYGVRGPWCALVLGGAQPPTVVV